MKESLHNGLVLRHGDGSFCLGTDSMLLAHFAAPFCTGRVADLGAGSGALGLLLCAAITALSISGLPTGRFTFEGFLSTTKKTRRAHLDSLQKEPRTMIFYEAPHKLCGTLADLAAAFGPERKISLCRELTKLHEEVLRMTIGQAIDYYAQQPPRGEYVLVVAGAAPQTEPALTTDDALALVRERMAQGLSRKDAVKQVAAETGLPKNALYEATLQE